MRAAMMAPRTCPGGDTDCSVTVDHRLAANNPLGAASGTTDAPNGVNLATTRSHAKATQGRQCRPRGCLVAAEAAAERTLRSPRVLPKLP